MAKEITMPKLSDTMEEGKLLRWLKREGDRVERGEPIAEVETDKADMEMEAFDSGVLLAIEVKEGDTAAVGDVIGWIGEAGERAGDGESAGRRAARAAEPPAAPPPEKRAEPAAEPGAGPGAEPVREPGAAAREANEEVPGPHADIADVIEPEGAREEEEEGEEGSARQAPPGTAAAEPAQPAPGPGRPTRGMNDRLPRLHEPPERFPRVKISPVARRLAAEAGLDPSDLEGSGPDGRIVRRDVEGALEARGRGPAAPEEPRAAAPPPPRIRGAPAGAREPGRARRPAAAPSGPEPPPVPVAAGELGAELPHTRLRRAIAARMADSKRTVPHFYTTAAVRMDEALRLKDALALRAPEERVSQSHLLVKAAALALERYPRVSAVFEEERIRIPARIDVGLAVAVEDGLIVPVLRDCAAKPLFEVARDARAAVERVRAGKLAADDLQGATFTVSNMGMFEIEQFAAIIAPPQSAILAAGATAEQPVVEDGRVVPGRVLRLTLSADHRVIDGVLAAAFLVEVKRFLENPLALVI